MRWLPVLTLALLLPLAGCTHTRTDAYPVQTQGAYLLDTGDAVRVTVYGDAELSTTYRIDDAGSIAFPLVGPIKVRGETTKGAAARLASALANGYMRNPNVAVEVAEYRPFFIEGEINKAGQFPYVYGMTVRAAIATSGGFKDTADRGRALVYRRQGAQMARLNVNLDAPINPGDTIVILERWF
jgi:polysaccharide export outer membrane protein